MSVETRERPSAESLEEQIAALEAQLADMHKQLEEAKAAKAAESTDDSVTESTDGAGATSTSPLKLDGSVVLASVSRPVVDRLRLYRWGRESITQQEVMDIVNGLEEPYNSEVSQYIEKNDIKWLQKYLNSKIDSWEIDLAGLKDALTARWIRLRGNHILEDGKFWPQTLETIRFFAQEQGPEPGPDPIEPDPEKPDDSVEKETNLDWIKEEMSDAMQDIKNKWKWNRSPERNSYNDNFEIDKARNRVILRTWWVSLRSSAKEHISDNRCEIDWKTWDMYVICKGNEYKMPLHFGKFTLDSKWYPNGDNINNREKVRAFTEVWNLMNMLKAHAVFNWKWAIEYQDSSFVGRAMYLPFVGVDGIHLNDGVIWWASDTLLVNESTLKNLADKYSHLWLKFDKETKIQIASLLTAMKLDLWKIRWNPDIERRVGIDPLDDEHKRWVKHYSKTYSGA